MDAYRLGLNGKQAVWATKKYHGHRTIPESLLEEYDKELKGMIWVQIGIIALISLLHTSKNMPSIIIVFDLLHWVTCHVMLLVMGVIYLSAVCNLVDGFLHLKSVI
jgi:hypothetical protein